MQTDENLYKSNNVKIVEILFYSFPVAFIIGNFALSLNLLLFIITSLFLIKRQKLIIKFEKIYWIPAAFFLFLFLITLIQFDNVFESFISSEEGYGFNEKKLKKVPFEDHPAFKAFSLIRFLILIFLIDILFFNKILNVKKFFVITLICTSFVSIDLIIQFIFGTDLLGYESESHYGKLGNIRTGKHSGPFGDEFIAGAYLLKFSFLSFFLIFQISKDKNFSTLIPILFFVIHALAIGIAGNRMPFFLFLFGSFLIILFLKRLRLITTVGLIIFFTLFYNISKNDLGIKHQYLKFFQEVNNIGKYVLQKVISVENLENSNIKILDRAEVESTEVVINIFKKGGGKLDSGHGGIWNTSIEMWKEQPIFGYGLKSFRFKCRDILSKAGNSNIITSFKTTSHRHSFDCSNHSHNYYLEFLSETGLVGTFLIVIFFVLILKNSFYYIKKYNKNYSSELIILIPIILTIFLEIWPLRSTGSFFSTWNATWFWIFIALSVALGRNFKINSLKY